MKSAEITARARIAAKSQHPVDVRDPNVRKSSRKDARLAAMVNRMLIYRKVPLGHSDEVVKVKVTE